MMNKKMLKQAQEIQKQMTQLQQELEESTVESNVGGGMVTAVVSGKMRVESITIDPEVASAQDVELLQDMVLAATNQALEKAQEMASTRMSALTGGLNIPGLT